MATSGQVLALEREPVSRERSADLFDRLAAEVRNRDQLVLGLRGEIADRLDADPLEAVVGAHPELELLDRVVLHPVRGGRFRGRLGGRRAETLVPLEIGVDRALAA